MIDMASNKTIDGRGQYIRLFDAGIDITDGTANVVVENIIFKQGDPNKTEDALRVKQDAHTVWIDHVSLSDYPDGLLDITRAATDITVSWCKFSNHDKVMLIGADPSHTGDTVIRVTLHHNWFKQTIQRHPRLRFGKVHAFNNFYDEWGSYGAGSSQNGELYSEANVYLAASDKDAVIDQVGSDPNSGKVNSVNDLKLNGASIDENSPSSVFDPSQNYSYTAETANSSLQSQIEAQAGWQDTPLP
jgi:pectate lyase